MGWFKSIVGYVRKSAAPYDAFLRDFGFPPMVVAGRMLSWREALGVTAVWAACRVIAEGVAQVPWKVFLKNEMGRVEADDHPLHEILDCACSQDMNSFEFRETVIFHAALMGDAFVFVNRIGNKREIQSLIPITPERVRILRKDGETHYFVRDDTGRETKIDREFIWHLRGPSWDGIRGLPVISLARDAIRLSFEAARSHLVRFDNGVQTSGIYSVDGTLNPDQYDKLKKHLQEQFTSDKAHQAMLLDRGAKWLPMEMSGVDAQHIETRKLQVEEIARLMRVLPIMLMQADKAATYASAEQMFAAHVIHTLAPWCRRIEMSAQANLLSREERRQGYRIKFMLNGLMRGSAKDRAQFYARALGAGGTPQWMTQNEVRMVEDMNKLPGGDTLAGIGGKNVDR